MKENQPLSLQSLILELQQFWASQGCIIWQPYHTEVGAGTFNPATFLRVLGPEPWWVAYVEPSIRPADGRYGENPNRWQHYYQFQVILKPDPGNPQERFLDSLVALGINPREHDIRFVEDNWVAPTLGAWGLGWEVWLDGQEITQFTYFQQAGGQTLDPVSVEITYGLERILLAIQGVDSFVDIRWNEQLTYGDIYLRAEQEHSRYNFEIADIERLRLMYKEYEAEARGCLKAGLVFPAHDYVLKCSHVFNLLDARGAVGVTERASLFGRMRDLAQSVAEAYLAQRAELGFPWQGRWQISTPSATPSIKPKSPLTEPASLLLEIGTEELPVKDLEWALTQLRGSVEPMLKDSRLEHGMIHVMGTPRRLVVLVEDLAPRQMEQISFVKGPPADRAFDEDGKPTTAAEGFARSKGVNVSDLEIREEDGGEYVFIEVRQPGLPTEDILTEKLPLLISSLRFDLPMRWNDVGVTFSRPIRWLLALHGTQVLALEFAGLHSARFTRLLRFTEPEIQEVSDPSAYLQLLEETGIVLDVDARRGSIQEQIMQLAKEVGGEVLEDLELMDEVTHLVERPTALRGQFDASYLDLPEQVLISVMKTQQRCFPIQKGGKLLPFFIAIRNGGSQHLDMVAQGNEHVIQARFADAAYFVDRDLEQPLESFLPRLATMTFQTELGSMLDKVARIERLTAVLADQMGLSSTEKEHALRTAHLSKADLVTQMVVEMTSLQGEMGREYAQRSGEPEEVAEGIFEHHLPRFAGDQVPQTISGFIVGLADRLDTLMGLFAAGIKPTGAKDPYAMRRSAIGLVQMLVEREIHFDLHEGLDLAADALPVDVPDAARERCLDFIIARHQAQLLNEEHAHDVVDAILVEQGHNPAGAKLGVLKLEKWVTRDDWLDILHAFARCARITRGESQTFPLNPDLLGEPASQKLYESLIKADGKPRESGSVDDFLTAFEPLVPVINTFFDEVLVMTEDQTLRSNRLGLLQRVVALAEGVMDLSKLEGF